MKSQTIVNSFEKKVIENEAALAVFDRERRLSRGSFPVWLIP